MCVACSEHVRPKVILTRHRCTALIFRYPWLIESICKDKQHAAPKCDRRFVANSACVAHFKHSLLRLLSIQISCRPSVWLATANYSPPWLSLSLGRTGLLLYQTHSVLPPPSLITRYFSLIVTAVTSFQYTIGFLTFCRLIWCHKSLCRTLEKLSSEHANPPRMFLYSYSSKSWYKRSTVSKEVSPIKLIFKNNELILAT